MTYAERIERVADMTRGQLILHCGAIFQFHGCDGILGMNVARRTDDATLRARLAKYETAAEREDWTAAEDALIALAEETSK